jgi:hypothetical protein
VYPFAYIFLFLQLLAGTAFLCAPLIHCSFLSPLNTDIESDYSIIPPRLLVILTFKDDVLILVYLALNGKKQVITSTWRLFIKLVDYTLKGNEQIDSSTNNNVLVNFYSMTLHKGTIVFLPLLYLLIMILSLCFENKSTVYPYFPTPSFLNKPSY